MASNAEWAATEEARPPSPIRRVDELRRLYLGESTAGVGGRARLGVTEEAVWSRLRRAGIPQGPDPASGQEPEGTDPVPARADDPGHRRRTRYSSPQRVAPPRQAGVTLRPRGKPGTVLSRRQQEQLYLHDGVSLTQVAGRFDVDLPGGSVCQSFE
jgi:hypothetical protein